MNKEVMKEINEKYNVEVKYWVELGNEGYYYTSEEDKRHSEWNLKGEITYSDHYFK
jgi:hypothetical protein